MVYFAARLSGDLFNVINAFLIACFGLEVRRHKLAELSRESFDRLLYFKRLLELSADADGDIVECGVADGHSLAILAALNRSGPRPRHIWGLDSWQGLPQPHQIDLGSPHSIATRGLFSEASTFKVRRTLSRFGFTKSDIDTNIKLIDGWFSDTVPRLPCQSVAVLHIDADLYTSYRECLHQLWPRVSVGGVVALDEYHDPKWPGATQAVDEFLNELAAGSAVVQQDPVCRKYYLVKSR